MKNFIIHEKRVIFINKKKSHRTITLRYTCVKAPMRIEIEIMMKRGGGGAEYGLYIIDFHTVYYLYKIYSNLL